MSFRFRDLTIDIVPEKILRAGCWLGTACPNLTFICRYPTFKLCPLLTCKGHSFIACLPGTRPDCGISFDCGGTVLGCTGTILEIEDPRLLVEDLAVLRQDLQVALEQVEAQEKALRSGGEVRTRREAEALEQQLQGALSELQAQKERLR